MASNIHPKTAIMGVDSPIGLTVLRELGERGVPLLAMGRSARSLGRASRHAHEFALTPRQPIAHWLPEIVAHHDIKAVMAVSEGDLIQLAPLKDTILDCTLLVPDADKLALILDKNRTLALAAELGIDVPASWQPVLAEDFPARAAALSYPVAIKWSYPPAAEASLAEHGLSLEKVEYAADADRLLAILRRYDAVGQWPLVQTWCAGHGLGQMLNMADGRATLRFQHRRLREWPPTGGVSTFCETVPLSRHGEQMAASEALLRRIGWTGPAMVEYRHDPATGRYWLMEINGRFWGSIPLAYHAGAHFGWESYRTQILGETGSEQPALKQLRARFVIPDTKHFMKQVAGDNSSLSLSEKLIFSVKFCGQFLDPRIRYYVWSWRDPKPSFSDLRNGIRKALRRDKSG